MAKISLNPIFKGSKDTKLFILSFNRPIDAKHSREIGESIKEHGWLGTIKCVRTNLYNPGGRPRQYIVDGQHSYTGAGMVNSDFRFEVKDVKTEEEIIRLMADLNNNSKGWHLHDYLRVWSHNGKTAYKTMKAIVNETGFPLAPLVSIYSNNLFGSGGRTTQKFKKGLLELKNKKLADEIIAELVCMKPILKNIKDTFIMAFADLYARETYNRKTFLLKLEKNKAVIKFLTTTPDIKKELIKFMKAA